MIITFLLGSALTAASPGQPSTLKATGIDRVAWMQGCWEMATPQRTVEEHWLAPRGRSMIGVSRTVAADRLVEYETIVLREQGDRLEFEAHPSGQPGGTFLSSTIGDGLVLFENRAHDFPQRIGYERAGADGLHAWIEGQVTGKPRRIDFRYKRVTCSRR